MPPVEAALFMMCVAIPIMFLVIFLFVFLTTMIVKAFPAK